MIRDDNFEFTSTFFFTAYVYPLESRAVVHTLSPQPSTLSDTGGSATCLSVLEARFRFSRIFV